MRRKKENRRVQAERAAFRQNDRVAFVFSFIVGENRFLFFLKSAHGIVLCSQVSAAAQSFGTRT